MKVKFLKIIAIILLLMLAISSFLPAMAYDAISEDTSIWYVVDSKTIPSYLQVDGKNYVCTRKTMHQRDGGGSTYTVYCVDHSFDTPGNYAYNVWGNLDEAFIYRYNNYITNSYRNLKKNTNSK